MRPLAFPGAAVALLVSRALVGALVAPTACSDADGAADAASGDDGDTVGDETFNGANDAAEPVICTEFTEAGESCPTPSPVVCFAECEAGGCSCTSVPGLGPRWVCVSDFSCIPDCAPIDDACSASPSVDAGPG